MKQILFQDKQSGLNHVGILMDDGDVICGCCGGLVPADEVNEMVTIIEIYDKWISLDLLMDKMKQSDGKPRKIINGCMNLERGKGANILMGDRWFHTSYVQDFYIVGGKVYIETENTIYCTK